MTELGIKMKKLPKPRNLIKTAQYWETECQKARAEVEQLKAMTKAPLPTDEFNAGWEEGRHSADAEVGELRAEIERLRAALLSISEPELTLPARTLRDIARAYVASA